MTNTFLVVKKILVHVFIKYSQKHVRLFNNLFFITMFEISSVFAELFYLHPFLSCYSLFFFLIRKTLKKVSNKDCPLPNIHSFFGTYYSQNALFISVPDHGLQNLVTLAVYTYFQLPFGKKTYSRELSVESGLGSIKN